MCLTSLLNDNVSKQVSQMENNNNELSDLRGSDKVSLELMQNSYDSCEVTLQWIQRIVVQARPRGEFNIAPPIPPHVHDH